MCGCGQDRIEFGLGQSREKPGAKAIGKADELLRRGQFAVAIHKILLTGPGGRVTELYCFAVRAGLLNVIRRVKDLVD